MCGPRQKQIGVINLRRRSEPISFFLSLFLSSSSRPYAFASSHAVYPSPSCHLPLALLSTSAARGPRRFLFLFFTLMPPPAVDPPRRPGISLRRGTNLELRAFSNDALRCRNA